MKKVLYILLPAMCLFLLATTAITGKAAENIENSGETVTSSAISTAEPTAEPTVQPTVQPSEKPSATSAPTTSTTTTYPNWKIKKTKCSYPKKTMTSGTSFTVKGKISSSHKLKNAVGKIVDDSGKTYYDTKVTVKKAKKTVQLSSMDDDLKFSKLKKGTYRYVVELTDTKGRQKTALSKEFQVKKAKYIAPEENAEWGDGWHCNCSTHSGKHFGWDLRGGGKSIVATADGTVVYAKYHSGSSLGSFGKLVIIYHGNGIYSYYAHCSSLKVKAGDEVQQGDKIAVSGATGMAYGAHLHFELRKGPEFNGKYNYYKLLDKYTYKQFNPAKKIKR